MGRVAGSGYRWSPDRTYFVTLTAPGNVPHYLPSGRLCRCTPPGGVNLARWNGELGRRFNHWMTDVRRAYGRVAYFRAVEVQRRGALHVHVIVRLGAGAPPPSVARLRALAIRHGFGHSVDVQGVRAEHAGYVAKYVAKAADERADVPWRGLVRQKGRPVADRDGVVIGYVFRDGSVEDRRRRTRVSWSPAYRTWSASRDYGDPMAVVKAAQAHYAAVLERVCWDLSGDAEACAYRAPLRPDRLPCDAPMLGAGVT